MKCLMIMPNLLLQRTSNKTSSADNKVTLERRLSLWRDKKIAVLIGECLVIQSRLRSSKHSSTKEDIAKSFNNFMITGKINAALRLISKTDGNGILPLDNDLLIQGPIKFLSPVIYDEITEDTILKAVSRTKGAGGVSCLDADVWRRILDSKIFGNAAIDLRKSLATLTKQLCSTELTDLASIESLMACRLIPLAKNPGVRPIGIGEVLRRIICKSVMSVLKAEVVETSGNLQLCAGQKSGCEIAVHAAVDLFNDSENHGLLQIDANNAFNSVNRKVVMHNMKILCPEFSTYINNFYMRPARLFVTGGCELKSKEGTTQGDPVVTMSMYALGIIPLLQLNNQQQSSDNNFTRRIAFADDFTGIGTIKCVKAWWDEINQHGPYIGYYPNARKSCLIVKEQYYEQAKEIFKDDNIMITTEGHRHLGAIIGTDEFKNSYIEKMVKDWIDEIQYLSETAKIYPHSAYSAFVHGLQNRYTYTMRTIPDLSDHLQPLEDAVRNCFIKTLFNGYICSDSERLLFSLPAKFGGLGIFVPTERSRIEYENSRHITT